MDTLYREIEVRNDVGTENLAMPIAKRQKKCSRLLNTRVYPLIFSALILIQVHAYLVYTRLLNGGEF